MESFWWAAAAAVICAVAIILGVSYHRQLSAIARRAYPLPQLVEAGLFLYLGVSSWQDDQRVLGAAILLLGAGFLLLQLRRGRAARG